MNGRHAQIILAMAICYCLFFLGSCRTVPNILDTTKTDLIAVDVMQTQTEIVSTGKDIEATISDIKTITDDAKVTGEIPKEKVVKVVEYVDRSASQVKTLNETISKQTVQITVLEKSRITDNQDSSKLIAEKQTEIDKQKIKASIYFKWALIATVIALVLSGILWLPKLLKLIL